MEQQAKVLRMYLRNMAHLNSLNTKAQDDMGLRESPLYHEYAGRALAYEHAVCLVTKFFDLEVEEND